MSLADNGRGARQNRGHVLLVALLILLVFFVGVLVASAVPHILDGLSGTGEYIIGRAAGVAGSTSPPVAGPPVSDQAAKQLLERVKDSTAFLNSTVSLLTVIVAVVALALGASIWQTQNYAERTIKTKLEEYEQSYVRPRFDEAREQAGALLDDYLTRLSLTAETSLLAVYDYEELRKRQLLEAGGLEGQALENALADQREQLEYTCALARARIHVHSSNEQGVAGAAQTLAVLGCRDDLPLLKQAIDRSTASGIARIELQRAIDAIRRQESDAEQTDANRGAAHNDEDG